MRGMSSFRAHALEAALLDPALGPRIGRLRQAIPRAIRAAGGVADTVPLELARRALDAADVALFDQLARRPVATAGEALDAVGAALEQTYRSVARALEPAAAGSAFASATLAWLGERPVADWIEIGVDAFGVLRGVAELVDAGTLGARLSVLGAAVDASYRELESLDAARRVDRAR